MNVFGKTSQISRHSILVIDVSIVEWQYLSTIWRFDFKIHFTQAHSQSLGSVLVVISLVRCYLHECIWKNKPTLCVHMVRLFVTITWQCSHMATTHYANTDHMIRKKKLFSHLLSINCHVCKILDFLRQYNITCHLKG